MNVFLATYDHKLLPDQPIVPEPLPGTRLCLNLGFVARVLDAHKLWTLAQAFDYVGNCIKYRLPIEVNCGGDNFKVTFPAAPIYMVQVDRESLMTPTTVTTFSEMRSIVAALRRYGLRVVCNDPGPLMANIGGTQYGVQDDSPLKREGDLPPWIIQQARDWMLLHKPWLDLLHALTVSFYFTEARFDETFFIWLNQMIKLIRHPDVYGPTRRILVHTGAFRDLPDVEPRPAMPLALQERWAGHLSLADDDPQLDIDGAIVWGDQSQSATLVRCLT